MQRHEDRRGGHDRIAIKLRRDVSLAVGLDVGRRRLSLGAAATDPAPRRRRWACRSGLDRLPACADASGSLRRHLRLRHGRLRLLRGLLRRRLDPRWRRAVRLAVQPLERLSVGQPWLDRPSERTADRGGVGEVDQPDRDQRTRRHRTRSDRQRDGAVLDSGLRGQQRDPVIVGHDRRDAVLAGELHQERLGRDRPRLHKDVAQRLAGLLLDLEGVANRALRDHAVALQLPAQTPALRPPLRGHRLGRPAGRRGRLGLGGEALRQRLLEPADARLQLFGPRLACGDVGGSDLDGDLVLLVAAGELLAQLQLQQDVGVGRDGAVGVVVAS